MAAMASEAKSQDGSEDVSAGTSGPVTPALFAWADFDGDSKLDLAAVGTDGKLQLLASVDDGLFEDVTEQLGLAGVSNAALLLWGDYDNDGRQDLFVGAREGRSSLFHNEGGVFTDMGAGSGLVTEGAVQWAHWLDHDADGRLDLHVATAWKNELFRGLEGGFFEHSELPFASAAPSSSPSPASSAAATPSSSSSPETPSSKDDSLDERRASVASESVGRTLAARTTGGGGMIPAMVNKTCVESIEDQANPSSCVTASTTPTLGRLYPISANLFVAVGGNVGIGTTTPSARLTVNGTARITNTLTLNPSGDQALDVSTGSIYKGGALFIHTKGFSFCTALGQDALASSTTSSANTAVGFEALRDNTTGASNTATGTAALTANTTGVSNTAVGHAALGFNTIGRDNTAVGRQTLLFNASGIKNTAVGADALVSNTSGNENTAIGYAALRQNTFGDDNTATGYKALEVSTGSHNAAFGAYALRANTTGSFNIALGSRAGRYLTTGNSNIAIGNAGVTGYSGTIWIGDRFANTRTWIHGIRGVTTGAANAIPVLVDSTGQLGTVSSSRRFKEEIADMGDRTERLLKLRPVVFRYKPEVQKGERPLEYGLIAEEVAEVFPELVVYDEEGKPFTVKYHLLSSMLLNELQRVRDEQENLRGDLERLSGLEARLAAVEFRSAVATLLPAENPPRSR